MPDNKTVTFDALCASLPEGVAWGEPLTPEIARHIAQACRQPAAQSEGQEAIYQYMTEAGDWADTDWMDYQSAEVEKRIVYAAPVNGGDHYAELEREHFGDPDKRTGIYAERAADAQQVGGTAKRIKAIPTVVWWNRRDRHVVYNNINGEDLILRSDALAALTSPAKEQK